MIIKLAKDLTHVYTRGMTVRVCTYEGGLVLCSGYVLDTEQGLIVIDAPAGISKWIEKNFPDKRVIHLLLTHLHFDHIEDVAMLKDAHGCTIHAGAAYSPELTLAELANEEWGMTLKLEEFIVDDELRTQAQTSDWGGLVWQSYLIPGHSPDSVVYHLPEHNLLFSGDVLFSGSIGRTDFPGGKLKDLLTGIREQLLPLNAHTIVYPGHGRATSIGEEILSNPYLS